MKTFKIIFFVAFALATITICVYMFQFAQLANERARCRTTPLDQLSRIDYAYCVREGLI